MESGFGSDFIISVISRLPNSHNGSHDTQRVDSYSIDQGQNHLRRFFTVADVLVKIRIQPRIRADARPRQQQGKEPSGGVYLSHY